MVCKILLFTLGYCVIGYAVAKVIYIVGMKYGNDLQKHKYKVLKDSDLFIYIGLRWPIVVFGLLVAAVKGFILGIRESIKHLSKKDNKDE